MKNFQNLFGNQFARGIVASNIHLKNFVEDMLVRYTHYNTTGKYDEAINKTQVVYTEFYGQITSQDVLLALRKSRTRSVNIVMDNFEKKFTHIGNIICGKFEKDSTEYFEFFPHGLSEYHKLSKEDFPVLIKRLCTAIDKYAGEFDPVFVNLVNDFKSGFDAARGEQLEKKEDVTAGVLTKAEARISLECQLTINLLNLAIEYINQPEKGWAFFNQNLLNPTHKHPQGGDLKGQYLLNLPFGKKTRADFKLQNEPDYYLLITNSGMVEFTAYTCKDTTGQPIPISLFKLEPGESKVFSYVQMGGMDYLFFYTDSVNTNGQVTIDQVDAPII